MRCCSLWHLNRVLTVWIDSVSFGGHEAKMVELSVLYELKVIGMPEQA